MRDEWFIRGEIPMTKSEVRAVSVSRLELQTNSIVYDIGAGTGSVSVEVALKVPKGHVYAFEQKEEGCALIRANAKKAGLTNLTVVPGKAPESLAGYPAPDRVFLGGSSGNMEEILDLVTELNPAVQLVINVIALESLNQAMAWVQTDTAITERAGSARTERARAERCRFSPYPAGSSGKRQRQDSSYYRPSDPVSEPRHPLPFFQMRPGLHRPDVSQIRSGYRQLQPG